MGLHIVIAEERNTVRVSLCTLLSGVPVIDTIYEAKTCNEVEKQLATYSIDLILIQQSLIADITLLPQGRFVVLAEELDAQMLLAASQYNACGYVLSENASEALLKIVLRLAEKEGIKAMLLDSTLIPLLYNSTTDTTPTTDITMLTRREREVLYLLHDGLENPDVAQQLCISEATVRTHVARIYAKLRVTRHKIPLLSLPVRE